MKEFLDVGAAVGSPPIYILSFDAARKSLRRASAESDNVSVADIEATTIPVGSKGSTRIVVVRPHGIRDRLPVVMYFHGADWMAGFDSYQRLAHDIACNARIAAVFVGYHRSRKGQYRIAIEEAYSATKYVDEHADEFNVDTTRLAIAGDGVGAILVAAVGLLAKERHGPRIRVQLLLYAINHAQFDYPATSTRTWRRCQLFIVGRHDSRGPRVAQSHARQRGSQQAELRECLI
jgi:acetyl esterase